MMTDWCAHDKHNDCVRTFQRFVLDPKTRRVVWLDEHLTCECSKRGCPCFVAKAKRKKTVRKKK